MSAGDMIMQAPRKRDYSPQRFRLTWAVAAVGVLVACGNIGGDRVAGGNTSEVGNGRVLGMLYRPDGEPARGARVKLYPSGYDPTAGGADTVAWSITDNSGAFSIRALDTGYLNLQAHLDTLGRLIDSIGVSAAADDIHVPADTLRRFGSVSGVVRLSGPTDPFMLIRVFIGGSSYMTLTNPDSLFFLEGIPADRYDLVIHTGRTIYGGRTLSVDIPPGDTVRLDTVALYPRQ